MNILITFALKDELFPSSNHQKKEMIGGHHLTYIETGIGKARAAAMTMKAALEHKPDLILNIGTAGSIHRTKGEILLCNHFIDRDLVKISIDCIRHEIIFPRERFGSFFVDGQAFYTANTGDSFVTEVSDLQGDAINMESFAEADVADFLGIPFVAMMYITDIIGQNTADIWKGELPSASVAINNALEKLLSHQQI